MAETVYLSAFEVRVLAGEAAGGAPVSVSVVIPTITRPDEPFEVKVSVADELGYPSAECDGVVKVRGAFASPATLEVPFKAGQPAVASVRGVAIGEEGLFRFDVELDGRTFHSTPTFCTVDTSVRPIFWGDPHVHTVLSDCHPDRCRSLLFCFVAARRFMGLDWVTAADHVSWGRCELARWKEQAAMSDAFDDAPDFVTLPGYEVSLHGGAGGDNNVYMLRWPDMFVDEWEEGDTRTMCKKLREKLDEGEFFLVPHHTTRTGKHGEIPDAIYPGPQRMPVVEIHSKWGTSEYRGNPNPLKKIHPGPSYVVDLLNQGLMLGFIGGTDTHATMPAGFGEEHLDRLPGMTAVRADALSRENIFRGIASCDCYATSLERIYLDASVAGIAPGRKLAWNDAARPREIKATAGAQSDIETIDIVRNGETIHSEKVDDWKGEATFTDDCDLAAAALESTHLGRFAYYYTRVTCTSGAQAWSSPVWLTL